jgi:hypothetical protein
MSGVARRDQLAGFFEAVVWVERDWGQVAVAVCVRALVRARERERHRQ